MRDNPRRLSFVPIKYVKKPQNKSSVWYTLCYALWVSSDPEGRRWVETVIDHYTKGLTRNTEPTEMTFYLLDGESRVSLRYGMLSLVCESKF